MQSESLQNTLLWKSLNKKNDTVSKSLSQSVVALCKEAAERMKLMQQYAPQYTLHDETHLLRVVDLMGLLLSKNVSRLNSVELFLLILSAYFHDQGMVPTKEEFENLEDNTAYQIFRDNWRIDHPNYSETTKQLLNRDLDVSKTKKCADLIAQLDSALLTDFLRISHGKRSAEFIEMSYGCDKRMEVDGVNLAAQLAMICHSHVLPCSNLTPENGFNFDEEIGGHIVNIQLLSCTLRISDILDFDRDRTPDVLLKSIHFTSTVSLHEWQKHRRVKGWSISSSRIRFTAKCEHPAYESSIRTYMDWIDHELSSIHDLLKNQPREAPNNILKLPIKVDRSRIQAKKNAYRAHGLEFGLSRDELVKILMTNSLYESKSICVRELLQNALDAIRYRKAIFEESGASWSEGKVVMRHYTDSDGYEYVECEDNGVGMDEEIIRNYFVKVGRSYYRSPEFERERARLRANGNDFDPCSRFGIGFMSCFMLGEKIQIYTRKDYGAGCQWGPPLIVEINGLSGLIVVKDGDEKQPVGTKVTITGRKRPAFLDSWTDQVQLCRIVQGYALCTEFPITAQCQIPEVKEEVEIPETSDLEYTTLEIAGIDEITTIEQSLSQVSPNLGGFVRDVFLVDSAGNPCISNDSARWVGGSSMMNNGKPLDKKWVLQIDKKHAAPKRHHGFRCSVPVCADGILVSGPPGRFSALEKIEMRLGSKNSFIYSRLPALIDSRGELKPEITPARTAPDNCSTEFPPGWRKLKDAFHRGCGMLWEKLLQYQDSGMHPEVFWKLTIIRSVSPHWMSSGAIWKRLAIPLIDNAGQSHWIPISDLGRLSVAMNETEVIISDSSGKHVGIDKNLEELEKSGEEHPSLMWHIERIIFLMGVFESEKKHQWIRMESDPDESVSLLEYAPRLTYESLPLEVRYGGDIHDDLSAQCKYATLNRSHPLVVICRNGRNKNHPSELEEFLRSFLYCIADSVKDGMQALTSDIPSYWQKRVGHNYFEIPWSDYEPHIRPPFSVMTLHGRLEIGDELMCKWRDSTIELT